MNIYTKDELIKYIESISKMPVPKVLTSETILDYLVLTYDEDIIPMLIILYFIIRIL